MFSLSFLLFTFIVFLLGILFTLYRQNSNLFSKVVSQQQEGFNNPMNPSPSYTSCIGQGFSKEFCLETPTLRYGPNVCSCQDGSIGYYAPGFRGACICGGSSFYFG